MKCTYWTTSAAARRGGLSIPSWMVWLAPVRSRSEGMNPWLGAAALAAFSTFLIHTFVGGRLIARPLLAARDLPRVPRLTVYYCWHMVSLLLFGMAVALA